MLGAIDPAAAGLLGVVVGALITGGVQVWLELRRTRAERRLAARAARDEIMWAERTLLLIVHFRVWQPWHSAHAYLSSFHQHVEILGRTARYETWSAAREAERTLAVVGLMADEEQALDESALESLRKMAVGLRDAQGKLEKPAGASVRRLGRA